MATDLDCPHFDNKLNYYSLPKSTRKPS